MQYHLAFIVFSILYVSINAQSANNSTAIPVVQNTTVVETTSVPTTQHVTTKQTTTMSSTMNTTKQTTTISSTMSTITHVTHKAIGSSYVEPPPHPLGYCIRSRISCSKIRRCCKGPCNVTKMKCP